MRTCILAFIVYYIALLLVPCGDHFHYAESNAAEPASHTYCSHAHSSGDHHNSDDKSSEAHNNSHDCSPLCVCGCCHIVLSDQVSYQINLNEHIRTEYQFIELNSYYDIAYAQSYLDCIFQPPKFIA